MQIGDEIIEVNGFALNTLTPEQFAAQTKQPEGNVITLRVSRMDAPSLQTYRLTVRKLE